MTSENSPVDTDYDSIECFQNYTASEVFIQGLAGLVDQQDVESMIRAQKQILQRFEKTNEMLSNCNALSVSRLKIAGQQFKNYKQVLIDIKKDLDYSFKRINVLKTKLQSQHPESTAATSSKPEVIDEQTLTDGPEECSSSAQTFTDLEQNSYQTSDAELNLLKTTYKKTETSDSNSSESGGADSHVESNSISTSDTT